MPIARLAIPPCVFGNPFFSFLKNTPITGFFVSQRKGRFDIGVISTMLGKACYMDPFPNNRIKQNVVQQVKNFIRQ